MREKKKSKSTDNRTITLAKGDHLMTCKIIANKIGDIVSYRMVRPRSKDKNPPGGIACKAPLYCVVEIIHTASFVF